MEQGHFRRKRSFTICDNSIFDNPSLSLKAIGLYGKIMRYISLPPNNGTENSWTKVFFMSKCPEGRKSFESAWKELLERGYLKIHVYCVNSIFRCEYELLDTPEDGFYKFYYDKEGHITKSLGTVILHPEKKNDKRIENFSKKSSSDDSTDVSKNNNVTVISDYKNESQEKENLSNEIISDCKSSLNEQYDSGINEDDSHTVSDATSEQSFIYNSDSEKPDSENRANTASARMSQKGTFRFGTLNKNTIYKNTMYNISNHSFIQNTKDRDTQEGGKEGMTDACFDIPDLSLSEKMREEQEKALSSGEFIPAQKMLELTNLEAQEKKLLKYSKFKAAQHSLGWSDAQSVRRAVTELRHATGYFDAKQQLRSRGDPVEILDDMIKFMAEYVVHGFSQRVNGVMISPDALGECFYGLDRESLILAYDRLKNCHSKILDVKKYYISTIYNCAGAGKAKETADDAYLMDYWPDQ